MLVFLIAFHSNMQETRKTLVNAKYCDKFCHFQWKDGTIKHVHVTAEVHRVYERKMNAALGDLQRRLVSLTLFYYFSSFFIVQLYDHSCFYAHFM